MTDNELRELCHRFLDAIERHDFDEVQAIYHPDMRFWVNITGRESSAEESLATLREGKHRHRRRTYDDRTINTFDTGFLVQYSVNVVTHAGKRHSLWAFLVAECWDGKIWRLNEYLDSGKFTAPLPTGDETKQEASA